VELCSLSASAYIVRKYPRAARLQDGALGLPAPFPRVLTKSRWGKQKVMEVSRPEQGPCSAVMAG
jgi:hypothetical protein